MSSKNQSLIAIRVDPQLYRQFKIRMVEIGDTVSGYIRKTMTEAIREKLEREAVK